MGGPRIRGACEAPSASSAGKNGCYFDAAVEIGRAGGALYWHVDQFPSAAAARAAATPASAVVGAYGRTFLETVNADPGWRARGGTRLARVGPMPVPRGVPLIARFMQAMTAPGAATRPHRHPGAEGFYLLDGGICVETPAGAHRARRGEAMWLPRGVPMQLSHAGSGVRRSLLVVVHPSGQPWMTTGPGWTARGTCLSGG